MFRLLLTSLLFVSTIAVLVHEILLYKMNSTEWVVAEEESLESNPELKGGQNIAHEKITVSISLYCFVAANDEVNIAIRNLESVSKGFYDKPYNPPEIV